METGYTKAHRESAIRVGDIVRITYKTMPDGWRNQWVTDMDDCVGKVGVVIADGGNAGFIVQFEPQVGGPHGCDDFFDWHFPCHSLERIGAIQI